MRPALSKLNGPWGSALARGSGPVSALVVRRSLHRRQTPRETHLFGEISTGIFDRETLINLCRDEDVLSITPERTCCLLTGQAGKSVGILPFRHQTGLSGRGVTAAFLETGVYPHPHFEDRLAGFWDLVRGRRQPYDDHGHGTHVAGIFCGAEDREHDFCGIAPGARFVMIKTLDGAGLAPESRVIHALSRLYERRRALGLRLLSLSMGTEPIFPLFHDPMVRALYRFYQAGIAVFAASGNKGPREPSVTSPAIAPFVISVGSSETAGSPRAEDHRAADFSGRGKDPFGRPKPDLWAPGVGLLSLTVPGHPGAENAIFLRKSGTSMATPVAAGAAALLLQRDPSLTPTQLKDQLLHTARPIFSPAGPVPEVYLTADLPVH